MPASHFPTLRCNWPSKPSFMTEIVCVSRTRAAPGPPTRGPKENEVMLEHRLESADARSGTVRVCDTRRLEEAAAFVATANPREMDDQQQQAPRGRWLLQSAIAEVTRR
jgi:hypothetical protein